MLPQRGRVVVEELGGGEGEVMPVRVQRDVVAARMQQTIIRLDEGPQLSRELWGS